MSITPTELRPNYLVKVCGVQNENDIEYTMKIYAEDPTQAFEYGMEWAKKNTDNWLRNNTYLTFIKYYD